MRFIKNHNFAQKAKEAGFRVKPFEKSVLNAYDNECASIGGFAVNATKKELSQMGIMSSCAPIVEPEKEPDYWNEGEFLPDGTWYPY